MERFTGRIDGIQLPAEPQLAIAMLMTTGRCMTHSLIVNMPGLEPPAPSNFEDGFRG